jgi:hypothetical protein
MPHGPEAGKSSNAGKGLVDQNTSLENEPVAVDNTDKSLPLKEKKKTGNSILSVFS